VQAVGAMAAEGAMAHFNPELVTVMRAEIILKAAAQGETSYDGLIAAATGQIQTILSMLG
jgi:hypothetical protein